MLNSKSFQNLLILCIVYLLNTGIGYAQCNLFVNYQNNPSSCNATDGFITISSIGTCNRTVKIYKGSTLLSEGTNSLTQINLSKGVYRLVAERGCGCDDEIECRYGGEMSYVLHMVCEMARIRVLYV